MIPIWTALFLPSLPFLHLQRGPPESPYSLGQFPRSPFLSTNLTAVPTAQDVWESAVLWPLYLHNFALLVETGQTGGEADHLELLQQRLDHTGSADLGLGVEGLEAVPVVSRAGQHLGTTLGGEEGQLRPHPPTCEEELLTWPGRYQYLALL